MNHEVRQSVMISDRTAAALAVDVRRGEREERSLWQRYLRFLDAEGIDGAARDAAIHRDDERESERLFLHAIMVLLAITALVLALGSTSRRALPLPALADIPVMEISVAEPADAPVVPRL